MSKDKKPSNKDIKEFLNSTSYYFTRLHSQKCKICKLPENHKKIVNRMILEEKSTTVIGTYLIQRFPHIFPNFNNLAHFINGHAEYLPLLIDDVGVKSIFVKARHILDGKDYHTMDEIEKAETISKIEAELMVEYEDIEKNRLSMVHVLFENLIPLIFTRLQNEIEHGTGADIRAVTDASKNMLQMASVLSMSNVEKPLNISRQDIKEYDGDIENKNTKLVSLTERLEQSTSRK